MVVICTIRPALCCVLALTEHACVAMDMYCCCLACLPPCPPAAPAGGNEAAAGARAGAADPGALVMHSNTAGGNRCQLVEVTGAAMPKQLGITA